MTLFNDILMHEGGSERVEGKGEITRVVHDGVRSALEMMKDMPKLYDLLYELLPSAANASAGAKFGRIESVKMYDPDKAKQTGNRNYLKRRPKTKYFRKDVDYDWMMRKSSIARTVEHIPMKSE